MKLVPLPLLCLWFLTCDAAQNIYFIWSISVFSVLPSGFSVIILLHLIMPKGQKAGTVPRGRPKNSSSNRIYYCSGCGERHSPPTGLRCRYTSDQHDRVARRSNRHVDDSDDSFPPSGQRTPPPPPSELPRLSRQPSVSSLIEDAQQDRDDLQIDNRKEADPPRRESPSSDGNLNAALSILASQLRDNHNQILAHLPSTSSHNAT